MTRAEQRLARAAGLLAGLAADALIADPPNRWHPTAWFGSWANWLERRLYRDRVPAGIGFVLLAAAPATLLGVVGERMARRSPWLGAGLTGLGTWAVLGATSLAREGETMADRLADGQLAAARDRLGYLCGRLPDELDAPELARATIESLAENTADSALASIWWGAWLGLPGMLTHRAVNTLDAMVGHRNARYERFGKAAARFDDLLDLIPARLTGLLATALSPQPRGTWRVLRRDANDHPSPNGGWCEAAWAGALGVQLGGTNRYPGGRVENRGLLNSGGRAPDARAVRRAAGLTRAVTALAGLAAAAGLAGRTAEG